MILTKATKLFIVNKKDGHLSEMTLDAWHNSLAGGSRWEEAEVYTSREEALDAAEKYKLIAGIAQRLSRLEPAAAISAAAAILGELE